MVVAHHLPQTTTLRTSSLDCRVVSTHRRAESTHSLDRQCRHRPFGALHLAEDVRRIHSDHARCPIGENDDEPKFTISSLKRHGNQPLTAKRMRRRDNCYLCRQPLAKLLQSVAVTVGSGKTVALRAAVAGLDSSRHTVVYLANPTIGVRGMHAAIVSALGGVPRFHAAALVPQTADLLAQESAELDSVSPFSLVLCGQPTLRRRIRLGAFAALEQRIALRYHLQGMSASETGEYIAHHLALAGRSDRLFSDDANSLIHQVSRGLPRAVNNLAVQSLVAAYGEKKAIVDESSARMAVAEITAE